MGPPTHADEGQWLNYRKTSWRAVTAPVWIGRSSVMEKKIVPMVLTRPHVVRTHADMQCEASHTQPPPPFLYLFSYCLTPKQRTSRHPTLTPHVTQLLRFFLLKDVHLAAMLSHGTVTHFLTWPRQHQYIGHSISLPRYQESKYTSIFLTIKNKLDAQELTSISHTKKIMRPYRPCFSVVCCIPRAS